LGFDYFGIGIIGAYSNIQQTVRLIGTVQAKRSSVFAPGATGNLVQDVPAGTHVKKGTRIAHLDNASLEKAVGLSEESVNIAKEQYDRALTLVKTNAISKQSVEDKKTQWIEAKRALSMTKNDRDKTYFTAPFNGIVGLYHFTPGSQVQAGEKVVTFYDPSDVIVEFDVPASVLNQMRDGQTVRVNNETFHISHVQKWVDPNTYMSKARFNFQCKNCFIGEQIDVDVLTDEHTKVVVVPFEAVFIKNGNTFVYTVEEGQTALTPVVLGIREKDKVEISEGLDPDALLILRGQSRLYPWMNVKVQEVS